MEPQNKQWMGKGEGVRQFSEEILKTKRQCFTFSWRQTLNSQRERRHPPAKSKHGKSADNNHTRGTDNNHTKARKDDGT